MNHRTHAKKRISALLAALLLATSVTPIQAGLWSSIWGNLETAEQSEKDMIIARRAGIVLCGGLGVAALMYALWQTPRTRNFFRKLFGIQNTAPAAIQNAPAPAGRQQRGNIPVRRQNAPAQPRQAANAVHPIGRRAVPLQSVRQGPGECGVYALCNAYAIEQSVAHNQPISNGTVQNNCRQAYRRFTQAGLGFSRDLVSEQIEQARDIVFGDLLSHNNCALIGIRANGDVHSASAEAGHVINSFAAGLINSAHLIVNTGGHWVVVSATRTGNNQITVYHMDSAGSATPGNSAQRAINYLNLQLAAGPNLRA